MYCRMYNHLLASGAYMFLGADRTHPVFLYARARHTANNGY